MNHRRNNIFKSILSAAAILAVQWQSLLPAQALEAGAQTSQTVVGLTPEAKEAADLLNVTPAVQQLIQLRATSAPGTISDQELALKTELLDRIMGASLQVRVVADRIDRELSWAYTSQGMLLGKRQKDLNFLFSLNFMQGGILATTAGCEFLHRRPVVGAELLLIASSVGLGLSLLSFAEARRGSKKIDGEVNVLGNVYQLQNAVNVHNPEIVLKYMNSVPPGSATGKTRREALIESWQKGNYLKDMSETRLNKLASIRNKGAENESIKLIGTRIRMLYDTQWNVEQLDGELLALLRATDLQ